MKKGFTLIELLAVIVVLALILAIAIPSITNLIDNARNNSYQNQQGLMRKAAITYLAANTGLNPTAVGSSTFIKLYDLISNNYITNIVDPKDKSNCDTTYSGVKVTLNTNNSYNYETYLNCTNYKGDDMAPIVKTSVSSNQLTVTASDQRSIAFSGNNQYTITNNFVTNNTARSFVFDLDVTGIAGSIGRIFSTIPMHNPDIGGALSNSMLYFTDSYLGTGWTPTPIKIVGEGRKKITYVEKANGQVYVYDGANLMYSNTSYTGTLVSFATFTLGNRSDVNNERMIGRMYEFQIWNKELTASDVLNNLNANLTGQEQGLAIYYKFNEGYGDRVIDYSNNRLDATVVGATFSKDGSGVKEIRIKQGSTLVASSSQKSYTFTLTAGTYNIEVEDNVGNIATSTVTI